MSPLAEAAFPVDPGDAKIQQLFWLVGWLVFLNLYKYTPCFYYFFFLKYIVYKIRQLEETRIVPIALVLHPTKRG